MFQLSELVFDSGSDVPSDMCGGKWVPLAMSKARKNAQALARLLKLTPGDITTVNIVAMNTIGTLKMQVLAKLQQELAHLDGVVLVIHPLAPRGSFGKKVQQPDQDTREDDGMDVDSGASGDDSGGEEEAASGAMIAAADLPDSVTMSTTKMSAKMRRAQLATDRQVIERALTSEMGMQTHYASGLHIGHVPDSVDNRQITEAVLLIPTSEDNVGLERTVAFRQGMYTSVERAESFVLVSRKEAMKARRSMSDSWSFDSSTCRRASYNGTMGRGQLGQNTLETILTDFARHCDRRVLLVNDFLAGVGEGALAAIGARLSDAAGDNSVRVCYWGHEHRKSLREVAAARFRTQIGTAYLAGRLVVPGMPPIAAPVMPDKKGRSEIQKQLQKPHTAAVDQRDWRLVVATAFKGACACDDRAGRVVAEHHRGVSAAGGAGHWRRRRWRRRSWRRRSWRRRSRRRSWRRRSWRRGSWRRRSWRGCGRDRGAAAGGARDAVRHSSGVRGSRLEDREAVAQRGGARDVGLGQER